MVLTIQAKVLLNLAGLYYLVTQLFQISILNSEAFVYVVNCEVIWLSLGKLHHWFVLYLPEAIKAALLHIDVIVSTNVNVDREITKQKAHSGKMNLPMIRNTCLLVSVYVSVYPSIKVAEQMENMKSTSFV